MKFSKTLFATILKSIFTLCIITSLTSCSSDDDNNSSNNLNNEISIDGTVFSLPNTGLLDDVGENFDGSHDWDIEIENNMIDIFLDLNTNSENGLVDGTYTHSFNREAFTFTDAEFDTDDNFYSPQEGTIVLDVNGNSVEIDIDLMTSNGVEIKGQWSGTLSLDD